MNLSTKLQNLDLRSRFLLGGGVSLVNKTGFASPRVGKVGVSARTAVETAITDADATTADLELLFSDIAVEDGSRRPAKKKSSTGASSVSSVVRLENISKSFKAEKLDSGNVVKAKENTKIAFLNQEFEVCPSRSVKEEFLSAFKEEMETADRLDKVQRALDSSVDELRLMGRLLDELDLLQRRAQDMDLDQVAVKISKRMPELGFAPEDSDRLVASFSSGWQMRMSLGKILLQDPDLLLLDEPTSHLDLDTIEWLEGYLNKQDVPMVIISHDRAFLDLLCTKIVETDMGVSRTFMGNYSDYVLAKAAWVEAQYAAWEKQQKEIEHTKELINRLGGGVNAGCASSEEKKPEKLQEEGQVEKPFERKQLKIRFPEHGRSGRTVLMVKNLNFGYGDNLLFKKANLLIERGEKIAIIGPNGCGKSTLLKLIMGFKKPQGGDVLLREHNVLPNYFEQNQNKEINIHGFAILVNHVLFHAIVKKHAEALDLEKTVLETVEEATVAWRIDDIKGLLGRCNFKADMLDRKVSLLSGGEKVRLAFCKFIVKPSTLLVLDEPTNHLDIQSKEMLEEAISEYQGTVITISHDRYFIRQIVNRVVVKDETLQDYAGDYNYYLEKNLEAREKEQEREAELEEKAPKPKAKSKMKKQKMLAFQQAKAKSKGLKKAKCWK
ncbi:ABC transporter F family member [Musa troglodytarum]|uniref:ABC transporter F family member n=1 Tax=Musa troglodytarum TaxID=320322 RepID=A0A9E7JTU0_9LILI|nr:ABC transporter F family member [Musa troglodytarum]